LSEQETEGVEQEVEGHLSEVDGEEKQGTKATERRYRTSMCTRSLEGQQYPGLHQNRAGIPLLWGKAEIVGVVQPEQEKAVGRHYCGLSVIKVSL